MCIFIKSAKFLIWILAPFIGIKRNFVSKNVGYKIDFDNRKSIKELGINYSPVKKAVVDFFQQFIDNGLVWKIKGLYLKKEKPRIIEAFLFTIFLVYFSNTIFFVERYSPACMV